MPWTLGRNAASLWHMNHRVDSQSERDIKRRGGMLKCSIPPPPPSVPTNLKHPPKTATNEVWVCTGLGPTTPGH